MKKLLLIVTAIAISFGYLLGQDTTSYRLIGINWYGDILFFNDDTTVMSNMSVTHRTSTGHALFIDPISEKLIALIDSVRYDGNRFFYDLSPLNGTITRVFDTTGTYFSTADATPDGRVFAICGNGGGEGGAIYEINLQNKTTEKVAVSNVTADEPRGMVYIPDSNKLFVISGFEANIYTMELDTWVQDTLTIQDLNDEIHGLYYTHDNLLMTAYGGEYYSMEFIDPLTAKYIKDLNSDVMDLCMLDLVEGADTIGFCPGDSVMISSRYPSGSYQWYRNDVALEADTNMVMYTRQAGTYKLLVSIIDNGGYIWSEPIVVRGFTKPNITLSAPSDKICPESSVLITGVTGGTLQWFLDGDSIPGANAGTYNATLPGSYNMTKTNKDGCVDSAAVPVVLASVVIDKTMAKLEKTFTATESGAAYQWIDCDNSNAPINDATNQSFTATETGNYAVVITKEGCEVTSDCDTVYFPVIIIEGVDENSENANFKIYPVPSNDIITIEFNSLISNISIRIVDLAGKEIVVNSFENVQNKLNIDVSMLNKGIYMLELIENNQVSLQRIIKN